MSRLAFGAAALALIVLTLARPGPASAQEAWIEAAVPASPAAVFDIGRVASTNIAASIASGRYFVTDLGRAPSGVFRRIRNAGTNAIPFVMDGSKIVGFAPESPAGGPGGSGGSRVLPVAPGEVVEFVSLGGGAWQLVQYLPLRIENFGLQYGYAAQGIQPTTSPPDNWFQLGPIAGKGPEPDYAFAVNWTLHGGKIHSHGLYLMLPGDGPNIELRQADMDPADESPRPWTRAPYMGARISGRALVDIGSGVYAFLSNTEPGTAGYRRVPSFLYQGFTANIDFPITQPPTRMGTGGALVFKVTPDGAITPFQRAWFSNTGNLVAIGKAAFEACGLAYPYDHRGKNIWSADSPCDDADYFDTPGWANVSVIATDITNARLANNAAIAVREYGAHGEGLDIGYDPAGGGRIDRYGVHGGVRTAVETFDPSSKVFTYPTKPAFQAALGGDRAGLTGDGAAATVAFDSVAFDQSGSFSPATGAFTAPATGLYQLEAAVQLGSVSPQDDRFALSLVTTGRTYRLDAGRLQPDASGRAALHASVLTRMNAGDTARVVIEVGGGRRTVGVIGGSPGAPQSTFSGFLAG